MAQQKQENQNDKLSSILKDAVGSKKETIKDTAGRMAMGPFYDIGKEILDATGSMRDNAKDEQSTMGRLKNWGKAKMGIKPSKAEALHDKAQAKHDKVEAASDKAEAKHDQLQAKADRGESSEGHYRHSPHDLPLDKSQSHPERRARSSSGQHSQKGNNLLLPGKGHH